MEGVKYFWLNFHLPYRCRHSGECCRAGWPIPIEPERAVFLGRGGTLAQDADGVCVFHRGGCSVYEHRPMSCVHFPYVCLIDQRGVHVTLSHYCPTAASLLFDHGDPIEIVEGPPPIPGLEIPEGLDARESLPPLREAPSPTPQAASPKPQDPSPKPQDASPKPQDASPKPQAPSPVLMTYEEFSEWEKTELQTLSPMAGNSAFAPVIERFLAAKMFASWAAYQGDGIGSVRAAVRDAHRVLQVEMETACRSARRPLDAELLLGAIRQTDLQLLHRDVR